MKTFASNLKLFILLAAMVTGVSDAWGVVNWIGETPANETQYYVYSTYADKFLKDDNTLNSDASVLWTPNFTDNGSEYTGTLKSNANKYVGVKRTGSSDSSIKPANFTAYSNYAATKTDAKETTTLWVKPISGGFFSFNCYLQYYDKKTFLGSDKSGDVYIEANSGKTGLASYASARNSQGYWKFVSKKQYDSTLPYYFKVTAYAVGNGNVYASFTSGTYTSASASTDKTDASAPSLTTTSLNTTVYLKAVANAGYVFDHWEDVDGNVIDYTEVGQEYSVSASSHDSANPTETIVIAVFVGKKVPGITGSDKSDALVGDVYKADFSFANVANAVPDASSNGSNFYYTISHTVTTSNTIGSADGTKVVSYDPATNKATPLNEGTATITFTQNGTAEYEQATKSFSITVTKNENPIVVKFNDAIEADNTLAMVYGTGVNVAITSANDANTLAVNQSAGDDIATYYADQHAVYTSYKNGTATWTVSQPENYKYLAGNATFSVNVAAASDKTCVLLNHAAEIELETTIFSFSGVQSEAMAVSSGKNPTLYFDAKGNNNNYFFAQYSEDGGNNWIDLFQPDNVNSTYKTYSHALSESATHVRFNSKTGATGTKNVKNIKVLSDIYFTTIPSAGGVLNLDSRLGKSSSETMTINYSRPRTSNNIHIECDNSHFVLSKSVIENVSCNSGSENITVTFTPTGQEEEEGTITIYDESEVRTIIVKGKTVAKFTPEIDWLISAIAKPNTSYVGLNNILTTTNSDTQLSITSSDASIADYNAATETLQTFDKEGFVTFTISQEGNDDWNAIELQYSVYVTDHENTMCILHEDASKHSLSDVAGSGIGEFEINLDAPVEMMSADIWKNNGITTGGIVVKWYNAANTKLGEKEFGVGSLSTSAKNFVLPLPYDVRKIKFEVNGTLNKYVQNIKVYRANYLKHNATLIDNKLNFGEGEFDATPTTISFDIEYSGAGELNVTTSDPSHFALSSVISSTIDCDHGYGTQHIEVSYNHNKVGVTNATLTAQLGTNVITIPLTGSTKRPAQAVFIGAEGDDWENPDNWLGSALPTDDDEVSVRGELVIDNGEERTVESLIIEPTGSILVVNEGVLIVNGAGTSSTGTYGDLRINTNGEVLLNMTGDEKLQVNNFTIEAIMASEQSDVASSGQLTNANQLEANGDVFFDLKLTPSGVASYGWYEFAVPFPVDIRTGIYCGTTQLVSGVDFLIKNYHGDVRANGQYAWKNSTGVLQPGVYYLITVDEEAYGHLRLRKTADSNINNSVSALAMAEYASANAANAGWNGLGNPCLNHINIGDFGGDKVQVYSHENDAFSAIETNDISFVVGSPFFAQYANTPAMPIEAATNSTLHAPARANNEIGEYCLRLGNNDETYVDQLFFSVTDDATSTYQAGHDLVKITMSSSAKVPQLVISAYGMKLCDAELAWQNDEATFPLSITAPKAGDYLLYTAKAQTGTELYLLRNGAIIWNLSDADYPIHLDAGTTTEYSLLVRKVQGIATDINALVGEVADAEKFIYDGHIYIRRDHSIYTVSGQHIQ